MIQSILIGGAFVAGTIILSLLCHAVARRLLGPESNQATKDLAASIVLRVSALHVLIIALVFAQEMTDYQNIRKVSAIEAAAIADVYNDARRYGTDAVPKIRASMLDYLKTVIDPEWASLGKSGRLSPIAWGHWDSAYQVALSLVPENDREKSLRDHMIKRLQDIAEQRVQRENEATYLVDRIFWFAAISGQVFVSVAFYTYSQTRHNLCLMSLYAAFTGFILFFIYSFSDPYAPPGALRPGPFERLLTEIAADGIVPPG